ncbi:MAG TPA: ribosomal protein S18-alanine N-acetyltransferase [Solirubrobacteraceae bacterium]|nr:ribosomal protein S18-alanine N-acetyltransferase [Solirubrobacteraceae bacterium]
MIAIRPLSYGDLPRVVAVERRAFPMPWSLSMFVLEISKARAICLGAWIERELAGYLICARYDEAYHLMNIATDPAHRREGVGRALIDGMLARAGEDANITLEVRVSNAPAIALYESYGFRGVGTRPRYYSDTGEDAMIMWRAVGTPWETA